MSETTTTTTQQGATTTSVPSEDNAVAIPGRIVKILQALEEESYILKVHLPPHTTQSTVKALFLAPHQGDKLTFQVRPQIVPKGVVITQTTLANPKFQKNDTDKNKHISNTLINISNSTSLSSSSLSYNP